MEWGFGLAYIRSMKDRRYIEISLALTVIFMVGGLFCFQPVFSQTGGIELELLKVIASLPKEGGVYNLFAMYMFARLVTSFMVEATKPFREKFVELINVWIQKKIDEQKNE